MTKHELQERVNVRKQELEVEQDKLNEFREKVTAFINNIKGAVCDLYSYKEPVDLETTRKTGRR